MTSPAAAATEIRFYQPMVVDLHTKKPEEPCFLRYRHSSEEDLRSYPVTQKHLEMASGGGDLLSETFLFLPLARNKNDDGVDTANLTFLKRKKTLAEREETEMVVIKDW